MTTAYTPTPTYRTTITAMTDDDSPSASLFATPLEELADSAAYLKAATDTNAAAIAAEATARAAAITAEATARAAADSSEATARTALATLVNTRYYATFLGSATNAGNGYRFTEVYASGIVRTGSGGGDTFKPSVAGIYEAHFVVGFGASAGKVQPRFNNVAIAVEYRSSANGDCAGAFMFTADGVNELDFQNTSGGTLTPSAGTMTIRRVT